MARLIYGAALALCFMSIPALAQIGQAGPVPGKTGPGRMVKKCTPTQKALKHETCRQGGLYVCSYSDTPRGCIGVCSTIPRHPKCGKR